VSDQLRSQNRRRTWSPTARCSTTTWAPGGRQRRADVSVSCPCHSRRIRD